ncbi:MAG TPA: ATP-binding protein [Candidatus Limnocylindrales bacterium]|jgi:Anti-sigma regulatory factor (Ser/Thr protein kinase)|nr:ATP-binding protein [Candidatus Limnocylindrales bacterium]
MPDPGTAPDPLTSPAEPTITIVAGVDQLAAVRAFVRTHVPAAGGDEETTADFVQAVDELVCNVIGHGYAGRPGSVEIAFLETPQEIAFRIRDDAPPFDPTAVPEPPLDLPLAERRLGGMGIHLARTLTDGFDHRILPTGGNEVTVRKQRRITTGEASNGHHDGPTEP